MKTTIVTVKSHQSRKYEQWIEAHEKLFVHPLTSSPCTRRLRWGASFFSFITLSELIRQKNLVNGFPVQLRKCDLHFIARHPCTRFIRRKCGLTDMNGFCYLCLCPLPSQMDKPLSNQCSIHRNPPLLKYSP